MNRSSKAVLLTVLGLAAAAAGGCGNKGDGGSGSSPTPGGAAKPAGPAPEIAGEYTIAGTNPGGGSPYNGALLVTKRGDVYQFSWKSGGASYDGIGVQTENTVGVAFANGADGKGCSVIHYKVGADGALSGRWGEWGANASGTETATRSGGGDLAGTYAVNGTRLDGKAYKGSLTVSQQGAGYLFDWNTGDTSQGFGIRMGSFVSVGIGGDQCGFVAYEIKQDGTLDGKWSSFKSRDIGTEVATRKK